LQDPVERGVHDLFVDLIVTLRHVTRIRMSFLDILPGPKARKGRPTSATRPPPGRKRVAHTVVGGSLHPSHHHASMQALPYTGGGTLFVWHTDILPDYLAAPISEFVEQGSVVMCRALEGSVPPGAEPAGRVTACAR
jgi:hypothetical protein